MRPVGLERYFKLETGAPRAHAWIANINLFNPGGLAQGILVIAQITRIRGLGINFQLPWTVGADAQKLHGCRPGAVDHGQHLKGSELLSSHFFKSGSQGLG